MHTQIHTNYAISINRQQVEKHGVVENQIRLPPTLTHTCIHTMKRLGVHTLITRTDRPFEMHGQKLQKCGMCLCVFMSRPVCFLKIHSDGKEIRFFFNILLVIEVRFDQGLLLRFTVASIQISLFPYLNCFSMLKRTASQ